ncbi:hypothetical protein Poli38472_000244 [Pythium oligandrum]|uniref:Thaumatin-like protein n=1 Tax=Pythium oligandrum TaxID=41045 RepID=A0A8K1CBL3_PYTOL|nr:hypothetical protein Poli38472_000244 [Pythium oligandrum]|eukprot:TMW60202.1 hypothetical protein Poli38472_000244 [Pythium oligandrum]
MVHMTRATVLAAALIGSMAAVDALSVTFKNQCSHQIDLVTREGSKYTDDKDPIPVGATATKTIGKDFEGHFRHGTDDAATLLEVSTKGTMNLVWYDISIIPPHLNKGFEFCNSLSECKANSKSGKGYNVPMQVTPMSNDNGNQCREVTCEGDGCTDAYLFPKDDTKTHACPVNTDFFVTFCPSGEAQIPDTPSVTPAPSSAVPAPSSAAPAPSSAARAPSADAVKPLESVLMSPAATTPAPTTPAPTTPAPTTAAPIAAPTGGPAPAPVAEPKPADAPVEKAKKPKICH